MDPIDRDTGFLALLILLLVAGLAALVFVNWLAFLVPIDEGQSLSHLATAGILRGAV